LLINYIKLGKIGGLERGGGDIVDRRRREFLNQKPRERKSLFKWDVCDLQHLYTPHA